MVSAKAFKTEKRFLSAKDDSELDGKTLIIESVFPEKITDNYQKVKESLCVRFKDVKKILSLNQTNLTVLMTAWGDDYTAWVGEKVVFKIVNVTMQGDTTKGIQVDPIK